MPRDVDRHCCDGRCANGQGCPAFAPGVIDGPHWPYAPKWRRAARMAGWLMCCLLMFGIGVGTTWALDQLALSWSRA